MSESKGAIPKKLKRESVVNRSDTSPLYLEVPMDPELERYMKSTSRNPRRSLHDEVLRNSVALRATLAVPESSHLRRHSCQDNSAVFDGAAPSLGRRNSRVKRTNSVVSTRGRRGSKYYPREDKRPSILPPTSGDLDLMIEKGCPTREEYRKELRRRHAVWLVVGMFFFILTVSVLIVLITLTHADPRKPHHTNLTQCL